MAAIQSRTSRLAVTVESTEGTPVSPSASTEYVALQDDFSMDPSFDTLENAELKASLGRRKEKRQRSSKKVALSRLILLQLSGFRIGNEVRLQVGNEVRLRLG